VSELQVAQGVGPSRRERNDVVDVRFVEAHRALTDRAPEVLDVQQADARCLRPTLAPLVRALRPNRRDLDGKGASRGVDRRLISVHEDNGRNAPQANWDTLGKEDVEQRLLNIAADLDEAARYVDEAVAEAPPP